MGKQTKVIAESFLTYVGTKNLVVNVAKAGKLDARLIGLENRNMSLGWGMALGWSS